MHDKQHGATPRTQVTQSGSEPTANGPTTAYPLGRGYGHDYMRGGEVFGGYGYSARPEYEQTRGERTKESS